MTTLEVIKYDLSSRENQIGNLRKTDEMQTLSALNQSLAKKFYEISEKGSMQEIAVTNKKTF